MIIWIIVFLSGCACKQGLEEAIRIDTAEAYKEFLDKECQNGKCAKEAEIAKKLKMDAETKDEYICFEEAKKKNTVESYNGYLHRYPHGRYVKKAEELKEMAWFKTSKEENTIESYNAYLDEYPHGQYVAQAKTLRNYLWLKTDMPFDRGVQLLARDMRAQIRYHNIFAGSSQPAIIKPFKISETGEELTVNFKIQNLLSSSLYKNLLFIKMSSKGFADAEFVMEGIISQEQNPVISAKKDYHIYATLYKKDTGKIFASSDSWVREFEYVPIKVYEDSPIYIPLEDEEISVSKLKPGDTVSRKYIRSLPSKALIADCDGIYEKEEYGRAAECYENALRYEDGKTMKVYAALYNIYYNMGNLDKAEEYFGKLVERSVGETQKIDFKLLFAVNSTDFFNNELERKYKIWLEQISLYLQQAQTCLKIVGHSSKTGDPNFLSGKRAKKVQRIMAKAFPGIYQHSETLGMGHEECVVCTMPDDETNAIDRRVEFKIISCEDLGR